MKELKVCDKCQKANGKIYTHYANQIAKSLCLGCHKKVHPAFDTKEELI